MGWELVLHIFRLIAQVQVPSSGDNAWMWVSGVLAVGIAGLFATCVAMWNARVGRCEKREDKLLEDSSSQTTVLKDQSSLLLRSVGLIEDTVKQGQVLQVKTEENGRILYELKRELDTFRRG
jgi:hypothetical protein